MSEKIDCSWCKMRILAPSGNMRSVEEAAWKVQVSKDSLMYAGKELFLCDHHKNNLGLKFDSVEKLKQ